MEVPQLLRHNSVTRASWETGVPEHASIHNTARRLLLVEGASLGEEGLSSLGLSTDDGESLDAEGLAGLDDSSVPGGNALVGLLSVGGSLDRDDLSGLVLLQVGLLQSTGGLDLGSTEDDSL